MMATKPFRIDIEGERELSRRLTKFGGRAAKKILKKAAKEAGRKVKAKSSSMAPKDTGAMSRSYRQRNVTYKHKVGIGIFKEGVNRSTGYRYRFEVKRIIAEDIGNQVYIDQDSLKRHASKGKKSVKIAFAKRRGGKVRSVLHYFYPAAVEWGTSRQIGRRPMTRAMRSSESAVRTIYIRELKRLVMQAGR